MRALIATRTKRQKKKNYKTIEAVDFGPKLSRILIFFKDFNKLFIINLLECLYKCS